LIKLEPKQAGNFDQRGFEYTHLNKYDKAIEDFDRAIELDPNFARAYRNRANAHAKLKQAPKEIADRHIATALDQGLTKEEYDQGYVSLFDGKTLKGWKEATHGFVVDKGLLDDHFTNP
jgi:tetratricopeptide (TPR) repeat protein